MGVPGYRVGMPKSRPSTPSKHPGSSGRAPGRGTGRAPSRTGDKAGARTVRVAANEESDRNSDSQVLTLEDRRVPLVFQQNKRARRIIIRLDHGTAGIVVVLPTRASRDQGRRFALLNKGWIRDRLDLLPPAVRFEPGAIIPFLGVEHRIRHRRQGRVAIWREGNEIHVGGDPERLPQRVEEWLKREARREIERRARRKAALIDREISKIAIRDPKSRWGSCSPTGALSFSWRLVLAPRSVLDYVVAHEVAHLKELNHGPRFWKLCGALTRNADDARAWLHRHGPALHRYGC
jgi:predicted metal-dependent hydrolase